MSIYLTDAKKRANNLYDYWKDDPSINDKEYLEECSRMIQGNWTEEERIAIYLEMYQELENILAGDIPIEALSIIQQEWMGVLEEQFADGTPFTEQQVINWLLGGYPSKPE